MAEADFPKFDFSLNLTQEQFGPAIIVEFAYIHANLAALFDLQAGSFAGNASAGDPTGQAIKDLQQQLTSGRNDYFLKILKSLEDLTPAK